MTAEMKTRVLEVLAEIKTDLETDTAKWEGAALTGANVAVMLGEIRGTIHGLAGVVAKIAEELLDAD